MLQAHLNAVEKTLLALSAVPANSGHSLHKGTPRESFVKKFLSTHLSAEVAIGSGEIISSECRPNEARNQLDIVIYRKNYPKLDFEGGINAFLVESVIATIEVKSTLDKSGMEQAIRTSRRLKSLPRSINAAFSSGYQPPSILNYVVAYEGPASMATIKDWIPTIHEAERIVPYPEGWPVADRLQIPSPSLDGVFVLGKGFLYFDNSPLSFEVNDPQVAESLIRWGAVDTKENNLYFLFMLLTVALGGISGSWLNPQPYLEGKRIFDSGEISYTCVRNTPTS